MPTSIIEDSSKAGIQVGDVVRCGKLRIMCSNIKSSTFSGVVLHGNEDWQIGHYSDNWDISKFEKDCVTITFV